jgi:hypothetical protein
MTAPRHNGTSLGDAVFPAGTHRVCRESLVADVDLHPKLATRQTPAIERLTRARRWRVLRKARSSESCVATPIVARQMFPSREGRKAGA